MYTKEMILSYLPEGFALIGPNTISDSTTPIHIICNNGHHWDTARISNLKKGVKCPNCRKIWNKVTPKEFETKAKFLGYEVLSEYLGAERKVRVKCI